MFNRTCKLCGADFTAKTDRRVYCSRKCVDRGKPSAKWQGRENAPAGLHGASGYHRGCRCEACGSGHAEKMRQWFAEYQAEHGVSYPVSWRKRYRLETGKAAPGAGGGDWISRRRRLMLYERDGWTCYICSLVMSPETPFNDMDALTLDHLKPRSKGGSDDESNLKTCCRYCNLKKGVSHGGQEAASASSGCIS